MKKEMFCVDDHDDMLSELYERMISPPAGAKCAMPGPGNCVGACRQFIGGMRSDPVGPGEVASLTYCLPFDFEVEGVVFTDNAIQAFATAILLVSDSRLDLFVDSFQLRRFVSVGGKDGEELFFKKGSTVEVRATNTSDKPAALELGLMGFSRKDSP